MSRGHTAECEADMCLTMWGWGDLLIGVAGYGLNIPLVSASCSGSKDLGKESTLTWVIFGKGPQVWLQARKT